MRTCACVRDANGRDTAGGAGAARLGLITTPCTARTHNHTLQVFCWCFVIISLRCKITTPCTARTHNHTLQLCGWCGWLRELGERKGMEWDITDKNGFAVKGGQGGRHRARAHRQRQRQPRCQTQSKCAPTKSKAAKVPDTEKGLPSTTSRPSPTAKVSESPLITSCKKSSVSPGKRYPFV